MLCPKVWNFSPPAAAYSFKRGDFTKDSPICDKIINSHHFNHLMSVVLPNSSSAPVNLTNSLNVDSEYYKILNVSVAEFVNKEFIESFVKEGRLTVLSDNSQIDVDDCLCITPSGQLVLSLLRETYVELGLEGTPSSFCSGTPTRYIVTVDLCSTSFTPGKRNYSRVREALQERLHSFDVLLVWESPGQNVCPSSVASLFHSHGYSVLLCKPRASQRIEKAVGVPILPVNDGDNANIDDKTEEAENLLEWLGNFSLQTDLTSGSPENFINSYEPPTSTVKCNEVLVLEWRGFFSVQRIYKFYIDLRKFLEEHPMCLWGSLHVQGFADSPLGWGRQEHMFYSDGDNHYTLFLQSPHFLACTVSSSNKRPQKTTKCKK